MLILRGKEILTEFSGLSIPEIGSTLDRRQYLIHSTLPPRLVEVNNDPWETMLFYKQGIVHETLFVGGNILEMQRNRVFFHVSAWQGSWS